MNEKVPSKNIDQLMAEADDLIAQINSGFVDDMEDRHRLEFEQHAKNLEKLKSEVKDGDAGEKKKTSYLTSSAQGMHEAFEDIVKAMKEFKNKVS